MDISKCILLKENACILIQISQKFVLKGEIDIVKALVQVMARHRIGTSHYLNQRYPSSKAALGQNELIEFVVCSGRVKFWHICSTSPRHWVLTDMASGCLISEWRYVSTMLAWYDELLPWRLSYHNADINIIWKYLLSLQYNQGPLLLTWFNFNPSMDK